MYGIVLIAVLAVMGGVIAYIGDKLGTKVGKRKMTLFGLRPKHTSIIVTIITGILIASTTLGILTLASRDVRTALFGMKALKTELAVLSAEVAAKNSELADSRTALEAKTAEYSTLNAKIKNTTEQLRNITAELSTVAAERDRTTAALKQVEADYAQVQGNLAEARQKIQTLQATKDELDVRITALNESKASLQSDVDRLNELTTKLNKGIQAVREGAIAFRAGEVLSTSVLSQQEKDNQAEKALTSIIYRTNQSLLDRLDVTDKDLEILWISKNDFDQAVAILDSASEGVVVRISAAGNIVYGEPVIGQIELFPNHLIYSQGMVVDSAVFVTGSDQGKAEEIVLSFLQKVNAAAVKQGILPDPLQGTVGEMGGAQLYDTINQVKRCSGKVQLTAVAKNDTYAAGPLKITIQVRNIVE
ncbi:MAG: DUF3084 domain-containing protein [Veillonellales bacterium]